MPISTRGLVSHWIVQLAMIVKLTYSQLYCNSFELVTFLLIADTNKRNFIDGDDC
jgi:hypothetical protein